MTLKKNGTTNQLAERLGVQGATVRRALCVKGHYMSLRPDRLPNGRLQWDLEAAENLINKTS